MKGTCSHCGQHVQHICLWCDEPAVAFCDAWIGSECGPERLFSHKDKPHLCDAPMCADHVKQVGWICGETADSIDHCPAHISDPVTIDSAAKSKAECEAARRAVHAEVRRQRIKDGNPPRICP